MSRARLEIEMISVPQDYRVYGIVRDGNNEVGLLVRHKSSETYEQMNADGCRTLDQRKVMAAMSDASLT